MICPCRTCARKGCGSYHDICPEYKKFVMKKELAAARRRADADANSSQIEARIRIRGKRK